LEKSIRENDVDLLSDVATRIDDINKKRFFWLRTAANLAAEMDRPQCLKRLVELNADLNVEDNDGETPVLKICGKNGSCTTLQGALGSWPTWENMVPLLGYIDFISCGYDINHCNKDGENAAIVAVRHGNTHLIRPLYGRGINLGTRDKKGNCAIHYAVLGNLPEALQELIDLGVDVNCTQSGTGDTPAHLAIMHPGPEYKYECLRILVRNGANLDLVNANYSSAHAFDVTYPISAAELASVQRKRGYPHAQQIITEALEEGLLPRPTAVETGFERAVGAVASIGTHASNAAASTAEVLQSTVETTGSVLMMPVTSIAAAVSAAPAPATSP
jgi:ankyrin repeat protein